MPDKDLVYEQEFPVGEHTLRFTIHRSKIQKRIEKYFSALRKSRGIPFNLEQVSPNWKAYRMAYDRLEYMLAANPNSPALQEQHAQLAAQEAISYYQQLSEDAYREAVMLAMSAESKLDGFEPEPYSQVDDDDEDLPGLEQTVTFPSVVRDLNDPLEYRLKQILDLLAQSDAKVMNAMTAGLMRATVALEETNEDGFHPKRTGRAKSPKNARNG